MIWTIVQGVLVVLSVPAVAFAVVLYGMRWRPLDPGTGQGRATREVRSRPVPGRRRAGECSHGGLSNSRKA